MMSTEKILSTAVSPTRRSHSYSSPSQSSGGSSPHKLRQGKATRRQSSLPPETVEYLKAWMMSPEHIAHPYPTEQEKAFIMAETGIELKQLTNWFVNNRKRFWKPRVEARLQQKQQAQAGTTVGPVFHCVGSAPKTKDLVQSPGASYIALDMTQPAPVPSVVSPAVSFVSSNTLAQFMECSPRAVSVSSSTSSTSESENSSLSNDTEDDMNSDIVEEMDAIHGTIRRSETIDIHMLRPTSGNKRPSLEDVSILSNIPRSRIIRSFKNCIMTYRFPQHTAYDRKKIQSKRDAEVIRVKKQYLNEYLAELGNVDHATGRLQESPKKRARVDDVAEAAELYRPKYQRNCTKAWHEACRTADHGYDMELPSLEEAAHLFGY